MGLRVAAFGIGEDISLEVEVASESIISVVDEVRKNVMKFM